MDISLLGASNDTTSNGTSKDSFQDSSQAVDTQISHGVYWCTEVGGTVLPPTSVVLLSTDAPSSCSPSVHGYLVLPDVEEAGVMVRVHEGPELPPGQ